MPDFGNLGDRLPEGLDLESLLELVGKLQEAIPEDLQMQLFIAWLSPDVQKAKDHLLEAAQETQTALTKLLQTEEFANLQLAALGVQGALEEVMASLPAELGEQLVAALPKIGETLGEAYKSSPAAAPLRGAIAMALNGGYARPDAAAISQAVTSLAYETSNKGTVPHAVAVAKGVLTNSGFNAALREVIETFANARGVSFEDELGRWMLDAQAMQVPTNAINRYLDADKRTAKMDAFARIRLASSLSRALEGPFTGLQTAWIQGGDTPQLAKAGAQLGRLAAHGMAQAVDKAVASTGPHPQGPEQTL